jgi:gliding motility-associated-like protein
MTALHHKSSSLLRVAFVLLGIALLTPYKTSNAQCVPIANAVPGITYTYVLGNGTNATGVAYNPNFNIYYCAIAGNSGFPLETFDATGVSLNQTNTGFDMRGLWWNANLNQLESNGYNALGIWNYNLNGTGYALNTGTQVFLGMNQPTVQSVGDYDCGDNEILYYDNGTIDRYDRATNAFVGTINITGLPVGFGNLNNNSVFYVGCPGLEIGLLDYINKAIYFIDKATGAYAGMSQLPAATITNNAFRASWANHMAWIYESPSRTWKSYSVITPPNSGPTGTGILGNDTTLCGTQTLLLDATTPNANYTWQDASTNPTFNVTGPGQYYVTISAGCLTLTDTINVTYAAGSPISLGNDTTLCNGATLLLDATTVGATYTWQDASTNPTFTVTTAGQYYVDVDQGGCIASDTINVTFSAPPTVFLGNDTTICSGNNVLLDATTAGATYVWHDASTNPTFTATTSGTYYVDVTDANGCMGTDTINITLGTGPAVFLGNDTMICAGNTVLLDATTTGATYSWQNATTNPTFTVTTGGTYWVDVNVGGCITRDSINVTIGGSTAVNLGNDTTICAGNTVTLDATAAGATYVWQDASTNPTFTVTTSGQYYVTVDAGGCLGMDTINVIVAPIPVVNLGNDTALCQGQTLGLNATATGGSYLWQDNSTNPTFTVTTAGTYSVDVTVAGCTGSDAIDVTYNPTPTVNLGADTSVCSGQIVTLDATTPGMTYLWSTGSTNPTISVSSAANYSVTVTDVNGCTGTDDLTVTIIPLPTLALSKDTAICIGTSATLIGTANVGTIMWSTAQTGNSIVVSPTVDTYYYATVFNACDTIIDSVLVTVNPLPTADAGVDNGTALGIPISLNGSGGVSYQWSPSGLLSCDDCPNPTAFITDTTTFYVVVTDANGCTATDSVVIVLLDEIQLFVPNIFSPNSDGVNDYLYVFGAEQLKTFIFTIYNRWGEKIYESTDYTEGWDGTQNGRVLTTAAFAYVVRGITWLGDERILSGNVTLMRK